MENNKVTKTKLKKLIGRKLATNIFTSEYQLTIREFARIAHALGYEIVLTAEKKKPFVPTEGCGQSPVRGRGALPPKQNA